MDNNEVLYIQIDETGARSSPALITPDNMFYIMGSTWNFTEEECRASGYAPVIDSIRHYTNGDLEIEIEPGEIIRNSDGSFTQQWIEEVVPIEEKRSRFMERKRINLLAQCDYTQLPDSPLTAEENAAWAVYRQQLRDLPDTVD